MAVSFHVSDGVEVSCAILGDPVLSSSYLLTNHDVSFAIFHSNTGIIFHIHGCLHKQGEFVSREHPQEVPISPAALPPPSSVDPSSKMMYIWLTSYTLDMAAHIYKEAAYMDYSVKHQEVCYSILAQ